MIRAAALSILIAASPATAQNIIMGQATVIDGDTIEIHGQRIRLDGIDAPESNQRCYIDGKPYRCGQEAAFALADFIGRRTVKCEETSRDRYRRIVARCTVDGTSLASWMVMGGHALDWPRYSKGAFAKAQEAAKRDRAGIWRGQFQLPWEWRRDRKAPLIN